MVGMVSLTIMRLHAMALMVSFILLGALNSVPLPSMMLETFRLPVGLGLLEVADVLIFPTVAASYLVLFDSVLNKKWSREHVFAVGLMLAILSYGSGMHEAINCVDKHHGHRLITSEDKLIYWFHETAAHCIQWIGHSLLLSWAVRQEGYSLSTPTASSSPQRLSWGDLGLATLVAASVWGIAVGTRTTWITLIFNTHVLATWCQVRFEKKKEGEEAQAEGSRPLLQFWAWEALLTSVGFMLWASRFGGHMPTFDDLRGAYQQH